MKNEYTVNDQLDHLTVLYHRGCPQGFKFFGDEKEAKKIANQIVKERKINEIDTQRLVKLIEKVKTAKFNYLNF